MDLQLTNPNLVGPGFEATSPQRSSKVRRFFIFIVGDNCMVVWFVYENFLIMLGGYSRGVCLYFLWLLSRYARALRVRMSNTILRHNILEAKKEGIQDLNLKTSIRDVD